MGKTPAFQFYPGDWTRDMDDHPLEIEGAWIRICCRLWWAPQRGRLTLSTERWASILRKDEQCANRIIDYLLDNNIASGKREHNGYITLISRRMMKDEKEREWNRLRQQRYYQTHKPNANITPNLTPIQRNPHILSSSSSSKNNIYAQNGFARFWAVYPKKKSKGQAEKAFKGLKPDEQLLETMISKIERAKKSESWLKDGGKYIPYPATWIRARGWEDEDNTQVEQGNIPEFKPVFTNCPRCGKEIAREDLDGDGCIYCADIPPLTELTKHIGKRI